MPGVPVTHKDDDYLVTGTHHGSVGEGGIIVPGIGYVIDRSKDFRTCGLEPDLDLVVKNTTDGSAGALTAVTEHTFTCTLAGGTNNTFANGDTYQILKTDTEDSIISTHYTDVLFGRKVTDPAELNDDGRFFEDEDLADDEFSPGFPEKAR